MAPVVLGRQAELEQLTAMLDAVAAGPCAVVVEGPAGIGKTTVWQAALQAARARSFREGPRTTAGAHAGREIALRAAGTECRRNDRRADG